MKPFNSRRALVRLAIFALLFVASVGMAVALWRGRVAERGVVYGAPENFGSERTLPGLGVNVDLNGLRNRGLQVSEARTAGDSLYTIEQALSDMKQAGIAWIRQPFPWADIEPRRGEFNWAPWDEVVSVCAQRGVAVVAVLHTSPVWARRPADRDNRFAPPESLADFGRFAEQLALRYRESLKYYQIWDAPNIQPNWGNGLVDPTEYMRLLREGSIQIRDADPDAVVVLAGLAPTAESGPLNLSESLYLESLYAAGAAPYFDVVAAKPYGFWSGPQDRRVDTTVLNFSRLVLLRDVMSANADVAKPIWAVEMGWNALPPDWSGQVSPWGTDTEELQTERTLGAIRRARTEWPWLTAMGLAAFLTPERPEDARAGFALLDGTYRPRRLYRALVELASEERAAYPGHHPANDRAIRYDGGHWRVRSAAADVGTEGDRATLSFYGSRLDLKLRRGRFWGLFYVLVDGQPANRLPRDGEGRAYLVLHDPLEREATVTVAAGLAEGIHRVEIEAHGGWEQWPLLGFVVIRERPVAPDTVSWPLCLILGAVGGFGAAWNALRMLWAGWRPPAVDSFAALDLKWHLAALVVFTAGFYLSPNPWLTVSCLAVLILLTSLRPPLGLSLVTFSAPFFLITKALPGRTAGVLELAMLAAVMGSTVHYGMRALARVARFEEGAHCPDVSQGRGKPICADLFANLWQTVCNEVRSCWRDLRGPEPVFARASSLDVAMLALVVAGALSVLTAENFGVANRELRVVILEPVAFYFLIKVAAQTRQDVWLLADTLVIAAVVLALIGLYQFGFTRDVIVAEGVHRIRGVYASPNNLSLFLGRAASWLLALVVAAPMSRRRLLYGFAAVPVVLCLYLTYSRGAWLIGLPAALIFVVLVQGRRAWLWGATAFAALILSLIPVIETERISRLLNLQTETAIFRMKLWQATVNMIRDHPVFGVGLDNFLYQYRTRYVLPEAWQELNLSHPHNILLDYWTRLGLPGLAILAVQQWSFFKTAFNAYGRLEDGFDRALVLALMAGMVYALGHGLIDNSFFLVDLSFFLALSFGLLARLTKLDDDVTTV